ncbi:hypothetical protein RND71_001077 [Anisodus tanguticus]|uniref:Uncharacterized protein n=1 Tax=Anisodus tanguticus TaxID=243964 RepID=A0AAE1SZK8_9SOLA|nr:hypothetical protein RND71_001077 [Anisodus tanguticus]
MSSSFCRSTNLRSFVMSSSLQTELSTTGLAKKLTYEETLEQSTTSPAADFDATEVVETVTTFASENPIIIAGGFAALALPIVIFQVLRKTKPFGVESAKTT